jgi:hypothetical protein
VPFIVVTPVHIPLNANSSSYIMNQAAGEAGSVRRLSPRFVQLIVSASRIDCATKMATWPTPADREAGDRSQASPTWRKNLSGACNQFDFGDDLLLKDVAHHITLH